MSERQCPQMTWRCASLSLQRPLPKRFWVTWPKPATVLINGVSGMELPLMLTRNGSSCFTLVSGVGGCFKVSSCTVDNKLAMHEEIESLMNHLRPRVKALQRLRGKMSTQALVDQFKS